MEGTGDIAEQEGNAAGKDVGEDGGQSGECIVGTDSDTRDGAIGEDEDRRYGFNVFLDLRSNTPLVDLVLLRTPSVCQPRGVEDTNL